MSVLKLLINFAIFRLIFGSFNGDRSDDAQVNLMIRAWVILIIGAILFIGYILWNM